MNGAGQKMSGDVVVTGAPIHTFGEHPETVEAIAVADGVVAATGQLAAVESKVGPDAIRIIADGGAILPGFCDTHMHFEKIAAELQMLQLGDATSLDDVLTLVGQAAHDAETGDWIQSFGDDNAWDEHRLREDRLPTRAELDEAAPDHPVYLYRGPEAAALNSLAAATLDQMLSGADGWNPKLGQLHSPLARTLQEQLPAPHDQLGTLQRASRQLLALGITTIVDPGLPAAFDATWELYTRAREEARVLQRVYLMDRLDHRRAFEAEIERLTHARPRNISQNGVHGWGLKLLLDGEFENAWMGEGEPQPAPPTQRYTSDQLTSALRFCAERSWPICFHVMGRSAADAVVEAVKKCGGTSVFERNQVTLAHGFLMSDRTIDDCAALGVGVSVQPMLAYVFEREMLDAWGDLAHAANRYRLMIDRGVEVAGGSDVLPCEPLRGAAVAVNRTSRLGARLGIDQALTPKEAIALFTKYAGGYVRRPHLGTLDVGAPADFVCWPTDPLRLPVERWAQLRPVFTAIAGNIVWQDESRPVLSTSKGVPA